VLALSDESADKVADYVAEYGIKVRTAASSTSNKAYGVTGIPSSVLIGPEGEILFQGHPMSLSKGTVEEALEGARKPPAGGFMAFQPSVSGGRALEPALEAVEAGKLGKALDQARKLATDETAAAEDRSAAGALVTEIEEHVALIGGQAADLLEALDVLTAIEVYSAIAKELKGEELAAGAKTALANIAGDFRLQKELEAAEAFESTRQRAERLSKSKARKKYGEFAEKYAGTKAADRARALAKG